MIEETLVRIAVALETIAANGGTLATSPTPSTPPAAGPAAVAPVPSAVPAGPVGVPAGPVGVPAGPVGVPAGPVGVPAGPVGVPAGPQATFPQGVVNPTPAPGPQAVPAGPPAGAPAPVQGAPDLDVIRALANDIHRAHPEQVSQVVGILAEAGAQKMGEIPPAWYPTVYNKLKALAGVA